MVWLLSNQNFVFYESFLCMYVCTPGSCLMPTEAKRRYWDVLEMELQTIMSYHVDAGNSFPSPLEEQPLPWTTEPSLQPLILLLKVYLYITFPINLLKKSSLEKISKQRTKPLSNGVGRCPPLVLYPVESNVQHALAPWNALLHSRWIAQWLVWLRALTTLSPITRATWLPFVDSSLGPGPATNPASCLEGFLRASSLGYLASASLVARPVPVFVFSWQSRPGFPWWGHTWLFWGCLLLEFMKG